MSGSSRSVRVAASVGPILAILAAGVAALAVLLLVTGHAPGPALAALARGAAGSGFAVGSTLLRAVPLALTGLAVALAFRAGLLNIGAEGQLLAGATATVSVLQLLAAWPAIIAVPLALVAGALAGAAWAGIAALLRLRFGVLEVISTIMLNFVALYAVGWLVRGPLQEPQRIYPQSASIVRAFELPPLIPGTRVHVGVLFVVLLAAGTWWWLSRTAAGFRVRAVGLNPFAAATTGRIDVPRTAALAFLLSGALAGLGGAVELTGVSFALYENLSPGYGYTAIAVALLARLHPLGVLATGLLFGALRAGATAMQRDAGVPSELVSVVEACLILFVIFADQWRAGALRRDGTAGASGTSGAAATAGVPAGAEASA